jgi:branched-chain amino acid transport system substrate-binding protein
LLLLGTNALANQSFAGQIGGAAGRTYLSTPDLSPGLYPAAAERVLEDYRRHFGGEAGAAALYGYEAMRVVLMAIADAGSHGNDRQALINRLFAVRDRASVLGRYSIQANGETTLSRYGIDRIVGGQLAFYRAMNSR